MRALFVVTWEQQGAVYGETVENEGVVMRDVCEWLVVDVVAMFKLKFVVIFGFER